MFKSAAVGVSGDKYLNLYAVAWKGGDAKLYFRVDGGATQTLEIAPNDGASNNAPYTALTFANTDHYSVKLSGLTASSTIEFSTDPNFELTSADATISYARAIVCGVKLTDEPINPEEGDNEEPTPTPGGTVTIAEAIAAADNTSIVIENATVVGVYARGVLVEDTTGKLLVYAGSAVSAEVGDLVKVEGSMATYGGLRQVATPTVTVTGTTTYSYPTATVMDGAAMDAYLSNPEIKYVEYTGTLAISGYYYNVTVEGAATAVGSLAYVIEGTVDASLDGQKILVKGWTIGFSGGKYPTEIITSKSYKYTNLSEFAICVLRKFLFELISSSFNAFLICLLILLISTPNKIAICDCVSHIVSLYGSILTSNSMLSSINLTTSYLFSLISIHSSQQIFYAS